MQAVKPTAQDYSSAFQTERQVQYPIMDSFEQEYGFKIDRTRLEDAASVLACPVKVHAPNWQHGRLIYAVAAKYFATHEGPFNVLDIGTAKGFSALCLLWALVFTSGGTEGSIITSVDVLDPNERVRRNTIAEVNGYRTLHEILEPWPEASPINFLKSTGVDWLQKNAGRIHFAFVDGKHNFQAVSMEAHLLSTKQCKGDIVIFDDVQIPGVAEAVKKSASFYETRWFRINRDRQYAICFRK